MRILSIAAIAAALALVADASAAPLATAELQLRAAGGEFRGSGSTRRSHLEEMIWRLHADGRVTSLSQTVRRAGGPFAGADEVREYKDSGSWRIDGNRLCVEFQAAHRDLSGCYAVDGGAGSQVNLIGPVSLRGTLSR
jgi:hypothetical protein